MSVLCVSFTTTLLLPKIDRRGRRTRYVEEVEVEVEADVVPPTLPTIRMDPDDCDPGDNGEVEIRCCKRSDTPVDVKHLLTTAQRGTLEVEAFQAAENYAPDYE